MAGKPLIMAHRGASKIVGEDNTLLAFTRAVELECDMIEVDVRRTADGELVCFHDDRVEDMLVATMTHPGLVDRSGLDVPRLEEVAALGHGLVRLNLELKELGYAHDVLEAVADYYGPDDFIVTSFRDKALANTRAANPKVPTGLIVGPAQEGRKTADMLAELPQRIQATGARYLSLHHSLLCDELFEMPALKDIGVIAWTVDDPGRMRELLKWPLYAICTDRPDFLIEVMEREPKKLTREQATILAETENEDSLIACLAGTRIDDTLVPTRQVRIADGAVDEVGHWVQAFWGDPSGVAVVMDANTRQVAGERVLAQLPGAQAVELEPLEGWERLTPHDTMVETLKERTGDAKALVAVGAGTINDLTKYAAHQAGKPYLVVATAPSMNGFAAPLAALVVDGLKTPLPATPPLAVIADTGILAQAPVDMIRAGYADLLARASCTADYRLACQITGEQYDDLPRLVVGKGIDQCVQAAEAIGNADAAAVATLTRALTLSSFSMVLAGSSAPASGGEHLISHYWDMTSYLEGKLPPAWHGYQVALGTMLSAKLYDAMRTLDPSDLSKPKAESEEELEKLHGKLWTAIKDERLSDALDPAKADERLERLREKWQRIWLDLTPVLVEPETVREELSRAQVPVNPEAHGLSREWVRHTFLHACDIRGRYTVLHFARDAGILEQVADAVLEILYQ